MFACFSIQLAFILPLLFFPLSFGTLHQWKNMQKKRLQSDCQWCSKELTILQSSFPGMLGCNSSGLSVTSQLFPMLSLNTFNIRILQKVTPVPVAKRLIEFSLLCSLIWHSYNLFPLENVIQPQNMTLSCCCDCWGKESVRFAAVSTLLNFANSQFSSFNKWPY